MEQQFICKYCQKVCKNANSHRNHERLCPQNQNRLSQGGWPKGKPGWNKGLTKLTDARVANQSTAQKGKPGTFAGKHHTIETKQRLSAIQLDVDHSNHNRHSWGKKGYYDGLLFMSVHELVYYIYMRDTGHNIQPCLQRFLYAYKDKYHYYTPDFIVDGQIVEIKGKESKEDLAKYKVVPNLLVIYNADIDKYFDYVRQTYQILEPEELYTGV